MQSIIRPDTINGTNRAENFPVASVLLRPCDRDIVKAYYAFARFSDDIADSPNLSTSDKLAALNILEDALHGRVTDSDFVEIHAAQRLRKAFLQRGLKFENASDLLTAFRQDSGDKDTETWQELLAYCQHSAAPVGRFLLDLHGESKAAIDASDALCAALQILNHIQDIAEDHTLRNRHYIPLNWDNGPHAEFNDLNKQKSTADLRACIDTTLSLTKPLLDKANTLPDFLQSKRLRAEAVAIVSLANDLYTALHKGDPMADRIAPTKFQKVKAAAKAIGSFVFCKAEPALLPPDTATTVSAIVDASGSSFRHGMRCLPKARQQGMYAIYAFCRCVDDIADDETATVEDRLTRLDAWHKSISELERSPANPQSSKLTEALAAVAARYGLVYEECHAMIDGMRMDVLGPICCPDDETFTLYCRRVAVSAGLLSLPIMGACDSQSRKFAEHLGHALQCVNIIRDVAEDAQLGRCYLPISVLDECGISTRCPHEIINHPNIGIARQKLADTAHHHFDNALNALTLHNADALRPARLMMLAYQDILRRIEAQGWSNLTRPAKPPIWKKLWLLTKIPSPQQETRP